MQLYCTGFGDCLLRLYLAASACVVVCVIVWSAINQFLGCEFFLLRYRPHFSFASQLTFMCSRVHSRVPWQPGWSCKVHHLVYHRPLGVVIHVLLYHTSLVVHQFYIADGQSCIADCTATHDLGLVHHCRPYDG